MNAISICQLVDFLATALQKRLLIIFFFLSQLYYVADCPLKLKTKFSFATACTLRTYNIYADHALARSLADNAHK